MESLPAYLVADIRNRYAQRVPIPAAESYSFISHPLLGAAWEALVAARSTERTHRTVAHGSHRAARTFILPTLPSARLRVTSLTQPSSVRRQRQRPTLSRLPRRQTRACSPQASHRTCACTSHAPRPSTPSAAASRTSTPHTCTRAIASQYSPRLPRCHPRRRRPFYVAARRGRRYRRASSPLPCASAAIASCRAASPSASRSKLRASCRRTTDPTHSIGRGCTLSPVHLTASMSQNLQRFVTSPDQP